MLPQEQMIARARSLCRDDDRLDAAMMYGSFAYGEGDAFSDIEFLLFFRDEAFVEIAPRAWLDQISPVEVLYVNEHGIHVAIFGNLVRGEFHFHRVADLGIAQAWPGVITFPSLESTLIADKSGRLTPLLEPIIAPPIDRANRDTAQRLADGFIDKMLFGTSVLRRGEYARALEMLGVVHRLLLGMARLVEGKTDHWPIPSRRAEQDLSPEAYARFRDCAAPLDPDALRRAYRAAGQWGGEMLATLRARFGIAYSDDLLARITDAMK